MRRTTHRIIFLFLILGCLAAPGSRVHAFHKNPGASIFPLQQDTTRVPQWQKNPYLWQPPAKRSPIQLDLPQNVKKEVVYDAAQNQYIIKRKLGSLEFEPSKPVNSQSYNDYYFKK